MAARWPDRSYGPARRFRHWSVWPSRRRPAMRPQQPARSPVSRCARRKRCAGDPAGPRWRPHRIRRGEIGCRATGAGPHRYRAGGRAQVRDRRGASVGAQLGRRLRRQGGTRAGRARADHRQDDLAASWWGTDCWPSRRCPMWRATGSSTPRPITDTNAAFHDYLFADDPQRASAAGLQQPRCQGPDARGAAPRDVVSIRVSRRTISTSCRRLRPVTGTPQGG